VTTKPALPLNRMEGLSDGDRDRHHAIGRATPLYLIAIGVGLVLPIVAVALYLGIALYLGVPARTIRGLLRRS
jgi:hypothetical protein